MRGSSPLARGTHAWQRRRGLCRRFIPAGAGNTSAAPGCPRQYPVHPRWRGEHVKCLGAARFDIGSSPLARGTLHVGDPQPTVRRFIPAGAGNTAISPTTPETSSVHPRWRGEHSKACADHYAQVGSSPLARGTLGNERAISALVRFIPAGAGNTTAPTPLHHQLTVHPRWRGEHVLAKRLTGCTSGSSPLARGTRRLQPFNGQIHAGSSPLARGTHA